MPDTTKSTLLMTCQVIAEVNGRQQRARALVDTGSTISLVTSRLANSLRVRKNAETTTITGIESTQAPTSHHSTDIILRSAVNGQVIVHAAVLSTITTDLPTQHLPAVRKLPFLKELDLADPQFDRPGRIDLFLGIDVYNAIILTGTLTSPDRSL